MKSAVTDENVLSEIATALYKVFRGNVDALGITNMEVLQDDNQNMEVCITLLRPGLIIGKQGSTIKQLASLMTERTKLPVKITIRESPQWWQSLNYYEYTPSEQDLLNMMDDE